MVHDVSLLITKDLPFWPGEKGFYIEPIKQYDKDGCNVSFIEMGLHVGTHVDAPLHFTKSGKDTATMPLDSFMGPARVFDIDVDKEVDYDDVKHFSFEEGDIVILNIKKNNDLLKLTEFRTDYVYVTAKAARYFVEKGAKGVGVNYYSVAQCVPTNEPTSHHILLENDVIIIEGLKLDGIASGRYQIYCLPLKIAEGNGSPVRAILID